MATTATQRPTTASMLRLYLSLSSATKVIAKHHSGVGHQHHHQHRAAAGNDAFRCKTCGRAFPTFQALGGHRTSHKRPLVRAHGLDILLGARPGKGAAAAASDVHRCGSCGAVFPTGQALGGHMRRHRAGAVPGEMMAPRTVIDDAVSQELFFQRRSVDDAAGAVRLFKFI